MMTESTDQVLHMEAKLASVARNGNTALVCFLVRGQIDTLQALKLADDADLLLGVVIASNVAAPDQ